MIRGQQNSDRNLGSSSPVSRDWLLITVRPRFQSEVLSADLDDPAPGGRHGLRAVDADED
jgi:hypothetical protein